MGKQLAAALVLALAALAAEPALAACDTASGWPPGKPCRDADQVGVRIGASDKSLQDAIDDDDIGGGGGGEPAPGDKGDIIVGATWELEAGIVGAADLAANACTEPKLAADSVTAAKIQTDAVGASEIITDGVGALEIAADSVGLSEIIVDGVAASEIAASAVGTSEVADNTLAAADLAADSVGASEIATDAVGAAEIIADGVGASEIVASGVGSSEIASDAVTEPKLDAIDAPADGEALHFQTASGRLEWKNPGPFGMDGFTITEETLAALYSLEEIQAPTGILHEFYVDSLGGSDSNAGTATSPWQTTAKIIEQAAGSHIRFHVRGPFSPLVLTTTGSVGSCVVGEPATWTGGDTGTLIGYDPVTNKLAVEKLTGSNPAATDVVTGTRSGCVRTVSAVTDTLGSGINQVISRCESASDPCIIVQSWDGYHEPAVFNCNGGTAAAGQGMLRACGTSACSSATGSVGWVVGQNLVAESCDVDNWKQVGDGKLLLLNVGSRNALTTSVQTNQAFIAAHSGTSIWLNIWAEGFVCSSGGLCEILEVVNQASGMVISNKRLAQIAAAGTAPSIEFSGLDHVIIGPTIDGADNEAEGISFAEIVDTNDALTLLLARVVSANHFNPLVIGGDKTGTSMSAFGRQITSAEGAGGGGGLTLGFAAAVPDNSVDIDIGGLLMGESAQWFSVPDADSIAAVDAFSVAGALVDDGSATADWDIGGTIVDTRAAAAALVPGDWTFFTGLLETAGAPNPYPWQNAAGTVTLADFGCHPEQNCWKTYDDAFTRALPTTLYLPAFVLGREGRAVSLNGTDGNMGAR